MTHIHNDEFYVLGPTTSVMSQRRSQRTGSSYSGKGKDRNSSAISQKSKGSLPSVASNPSAVIDVVPHPSREDEYGIPMLQFDSDVSIAFIALKITS